MKSVDRALLEQFLVDNLPRLRAFARLRMPPELRKRESESDVVQVACLQVLHRLPEVEYRTESAMVNWLFGAVENAVRDLLKRHRADRRDVAREASEEECQLLASYATFCTPSRLVSAREEIVRIEAAMDFLSDAQRSVVMLSCLVGLSHAEVAQTTGLSPDSVRTHLHRGLARLSTRLDKGESDGR